jgi:hypothetical protein
MCQRAGMSPNGNEHDGIVEVVAKGHWKRFTANESL